jgi:BirA family biotin operon repressor/biotin-[acetyl-CoA-carboxylase] ligase
MSLLWPCANGLPHEGLTIAIGISVIHALQEFGISGLKLKWPNDVLMNRQKLAGILVESRFGEGHFLVIGLGVNFALSDSVRAEIPQPVTSLQQLTETLPDRNHLIGRLSDHILTTLDMFMHRGLADFLPQWPQYDALHECPIHILTEQGRITALACGINEQGELRYMHNQQLGSLSNSHVSIRFAS